jgi:hypothetical protein
VKGDQVKVERGDRLLGNWVFVYRSPIRLSQCLRNVLALSALKQTGLFIRIAIPEL